MNKFVGILFFLSVLWLPLSGATQNVDTLDLDSYMEELSPRCPYDVGDGWTIDSLAAVGDTVVIQLMTPNALRGFLPMLTEDNLNTKRLWLNYLFDYGDEWKTLMKLIKREGKSLKLLLLPNDSSDSECVFVSNEDFGTILANN